MPAREATSASVAIWLKDRARHHGFDLVGITTPDPPPHLDVFDAWLKADRQGDMRYLATERAQAARADPRLLLPECRSILVLGANYAPGPEAPASRARLAAYARGRDYHTVLIARAEGLIRDLRTFLNDGVSARIYTDTGPILERELAQRAGLGWIGRNTCLISPHMGSMVLLVEVLLSLELPPDAPFAADRCGSCRRCIDACPTGCILPDRTLDARRCISYLTIEARDAVPMALRPRVGAWMFGCDICQEACPWNVRFGRPTADGAFAALPALASLDPTDWLTVTDPEFAARLRGSPLKRAKRVGLARNAALVIGNGRRSEDVGALGRALCSDPSALVRRHAAWALGQIRDERACELLRETLAREPEAEVQAEIEVALRSA